MNGILKFLIPHAWHLFAGYTDETPQDYHCNLGPDGRRRDADERPELCQGTVEFVATKEYMVGELWRTLILDKFIQDLHFKFEHFDWVAWLDDFIEVESF